MMAVEDRISTKERILAVASLLNGKTEQQICAELKISSSVFNKWFEKYREMGNQYNLLVKENMRLQRMVTDLSIINHFLNVAMEELTNDN